MARFSTLTSILATGGIIVGAVLVSPQPTGAVPPLAAVDLEKTVMVDTGSDVCGTDTALTVGVGTTVRYCFTITNIGNVPLDSHTLVDDQLGTVLGPDHSLVLDPAASISVTVTHVVRDTITNAATVTSANNQFEIFGIEATDSLTVTATPPTIALDKTVMVDNGNDECGTAETLAVEAGTTVRYCYTVTNTGLTPLTEHSLVDDQLGTLLSGFVLTLNPGDSTSVTETAVLTDAVTNVATWTAENNALEVYDITATDELAVTILVPPTTTTTVAPTTTTTSIQGILPPTGPTSPIPIALMVGLMMAGVGALALARTRQRPAG